MRLLFTLATSAPAGPIETLQSLSTAGGLYDNHVASRAFEHATLEVCWRDGAQWSDVHAAGEDTRGGDCLPGDVGFVIETISRGELDWHEAVADCLADGMRLATIFEASVARPLGAEPVGDDDWWLSGPLGMDDYVSYKAPAIDNIGRIQGLGVTAGYPQAYVCAL
ncbi:MAG: hypothetical protein ACI8PZ_005610 [Myxococcota bacterium]|jgi:hypothetical protein